MTSSEVRRGKLVVYNAEIPQPDPVARGSRLGRESDGQGPLALPGRQARRRHSGAVAQGTARTPGRAGKGTGGSGPLWEKGDWVSTQRNGRPIDRGADQRAWKALLQAAGVRDARLHEARHTAATMLLVLGVPTRAVMEVMGWSQMSMTTRYQHVTAELVAGIAQQVEGLLWRPEQGSATHN